MTTHDTTTFCSLMLIHDVLCIFYEQLESFEKIISISYPLLQSTVPHTFAFYTTTVIPLLSVFFFNTVIPLLSGVNVLKFALIAHGLHIQQ